eukprot:SAG25_NODE_734_length_5654_cov_2.735734_7_plen_213_part_00
MRIVATDGAQRDKWMEAILRKKHLLETAEGLGEWEHLPGTWTQRDWEAFPASEDGVSCAVSHAVSCAKQAIDAYQHWQESVNHASTTTSTDKSLHTLMQAIDGMATEPDWAPKDRAWPADGPRYGGPSPTARQDTYEKFQRILCQVSKHVQAERALREIRPDWTLRAMVWGLVRAVRDACLYDSVRLRIMPILPAVTGIIGAGVTFSTTQST